MAFDADRDITVEAAPQPDGTFTLTSSGLVTRGRPELEIVGVPSVDIARYATVVINLIANYVVNEKPVSIGQRIAVDSEHGALIASLAESAGAEKRGLGRLFGGGKPARLRIVEPLDGMAPLKTLISTVMLWKAHAALAEEQRELAISVLREAIAYFPGDADEPDDPDVVFTYNWQNHLAYAALAELVDDAAESVALEHAALVRSDAYRATQVEDSLEELAELTRAGLAARATHILAINTQATPSLAVNDVLVAVTSPIWRSFEQGPGRRQNVVPRVAAYSSELPPEFVAVAVDLVATGIHRPAAITRMVRDTVQHWEGGSDEAPVLPVPGTYEPGDMLLTAALAHVARLAAAGMDAAEVRAHVGLDDSPAVRVAAAEKYASLQEVEGEAIMLAMMGGAP